MNQNGKPVPARECAPLVGASINCLYRMARQNIIPCQRLGIRGRTLRFVPQEVQRALQQRPAWEPARK